MPSIRRSHAWVLRSLFAAVAVCLVLPVAASAEPRQSVGDLQAKARQVADQLDRLRSKADGLDEQYLQAQSQLDGLKDRLAANQAAVDQARAALESNQGTARQFAIEAYVGGGSDAEALVPTADTDGASHRRAYLSVVQGDRRQVIDDLGAAQKDLADKERELQAARQKVDAKVAALAGTRKAMQDTISGQQQLLDSTNGQLADAVAKEQARRAAAEAAQARAAAEAQARADAAAAGARATRRSADTPVANPADELDAEETGDGGSGDSGDSGSLNPNEHPASGAAATAIAAARSQLGVPYHWAQSSPGNGFDCSGLTMWAYGQAGVSLPHSSRSQHSMTQRLSAAELEPGDLVFVGSPVHHVGLYIGGGQMIHAPHTGDVVKISSIYGSGGPVSFGRL